MVMHINNETELICLIIVIHLQVLTRLISCRFPAYSFDEKERYVEQIRLRQSYSLTVKYDTNHWLQMSSHNVKYYMV